MRNAYYLLASWYFSILSFLVRLATIGVPFSRKPSIFGMLLRVHLKRPEWLYYPGVAVNPFKRFIFVPRAEPKAADIDLCERLLAAYRAATKLNPPSKTPDGIWKKHIKNRCGKLLTILEAGTPEALAEMMTGMFQEPFLNGVATGEMGRVPGFASFLRMTIAGELLALTESLGLVRAENSEQGILGYALSEGWPELVKKIERELGVSIDFPKVAGAYGLEIGGALITPESSGHIYAAYRINEAISRHVEGKPRIVEIGAGFGGTAYWIMRLRKQNITSYSIVDLPLINVCQGYFLATVFGSDAVRLYGESRKPTQMIEVLPSHVIKESDLGGFQVLINENSMPEMPASAVTDYLTWAKTNLRGIFYSYNHEGYSPVDGVPQTLVPKAAADVGGYSRLSRNYSWVKRGYVEEVYSVGISK